MVSISARQDRIFKALADPSRRAIFETLARWGEKGERDKAGGRRAASAGEAAVKDLTARFNISQPAISQHLAALKEAGLVSDRRDGRCTYYRVEPRGLKPLIDWIARYRAFWIDHVDRLEKLLERMEP